MFLSVLLSLGLCRSYNIHKPKEAQTATETLLVEVDDDAQGGYY